MNRMPEVELLPACQFFGLGVVPYSPIARGVLSGKYKVNQVPEAGSRAARQDKRMMDTEWRPESLLIADKLKAHAEARGVTLVHWATAWVLNNKTVASAIAGPRTFEQWTSYFGALDYTWTPEDEALANSLVPAGHPPPPATPTRVSDRGAVQTIGCDAASGIAPMLPRIDAIALRTIAPCDLRLWRGFLPWPPLHYRREASWISSSSSQCSRRPPAMPAGTRC